MGAEVNLLFLFNFSLVALSLRQGLAMCLGLVWNSGSSERWDESVTMLRPSQVGHQVP